MLTGDLRLVAHVPELVFVLGGVRQCLFQRTELGVRVRKPCQVASLVGVSRGEVGSAEMARNWRSPGWSSASRASSRWP